MIEYTVKVWENGDKYWYLDGKRHREDGPAIEYADGDKHWYLNGKRHREDGPAIEFPNDNEYWYLDGIEYSKEKFDAKMSPTKELTVQEVSDLLGYDVKIVRG